MSASSWRAGWLNEVSLHSPGAPVRSEREDVVIHGGRELRFHSRLFHDFDPASRDHPQRTTILVTVYDDDGVEDVFPLVYYPLSAEDLTAEMTSVGFEPVVVQGGEGGWRFDMVVASDSRKACGLAHTPGNRPGAKPKPAWPTPLRASSSPQNPPGRGSPTTSAADEDCTTLRYSGPAQDSGADLDHQ